MGGHSREPLPTECQDLIRGLLQLRPRARLDLQQVAAHCWMLPATHALFCTMLRSSPGGRAPSGAGGASAAQRPF